MKNEKEIVLISKSHNPVDVKLFMNSKDISKDVQVFKITADASKGLIEAEIKLVPEQVRVETKALVAFITEEPRFSIAELEKILEETAKQKMAYFGGDEAVEDFIEFLKDQKKVQEALK